MNEYGKLYLVATPIGNLDDITFRALNTLKQVDLIAAEDTRHTLKLLNHFEISKPLISYYKQIEKSKSNILISKLLEGKNIALVSDAGAPGISDPGEEIVKVAIENNIQVIPIPGACAFVNGLIASGLYSKEFTFDEVANLCSEFDIYENSVKNLLREHLKFFNNRERVSKLKTLLTNKTFFKTIYICWHT